MTASSNTNGNGHKDYETCGREKKDGSPCLRPAGWGTGHPGTGPCKLHLGNTPNHIKAAAKQEAVAMGAPIDIEPHQALLHCVSTAAGEVHYCSVKIAELEASEVLVAQSETVRKEGVERGDPTDVTETRESNAHELNVWIEARHKAMDRLSRYSKMALDAGVAERQVKLAEMMAELLAPALRRLLDGLNLNATQKKKAPGLVRAALGELEGTGRELEAAK